MNIQGSETGQILIAVSDDSCDVSPIMLRLAMSHNLHNEANERPIIQI